MRRTILLLSAMMLALLLASGVAWAANITCLGGPCVGTEQNDRITGSLEDDVIQALGGRDHVTGRGGDDSVDGGRGGDEITGGDGGDSLIGGRGPDEIGGGPGTPDDTPTTRFSCTLSDASTGIFVSTEGYQGLSGDDGNDLLAAGRDNDYLLGGAGRNDLSGNGGSDCLVLSGDENERVSGGDGDDLFFAAEFNGDDIFCGAGHDTVRADEEDRVATDCEDVFRPFALQAPGATSEAEVTIITAPEEFGS
jgi:hypothetical protein